MRKVKIATIAMDLDNFGDIVKRFGLSEYSPNTITAQLTSLAENFVRKHRAVVLHGLDYERGTEEVILEVIEPELDEIINDLEFIRCKIEKLGKETGTNVTISIGIALGYMTLFRKVREKRKKWQTPTRVLAKRALGKAKKEGGNKIIVI
ncbi:MAG: hypothetical protein J7L07_11380 [Candidatus Odinarchaeota archaeon]|nr:hypothetical protein [Candidatus Odinarchaeota archaeon]